MRNYARQELQGSSESRQPAKSQDSSAFGGLPEILNRSPRVQAQLKLDRSLNQRKENDTGMPDSLKSGIEELSGLSLDGVKVHYNSPQPAQLNALAYAQGTDIHVAPGQEQHLPHETWHVVQQAQGRVQPTTQTQGVDVNDDPELEREADAMGSKAEKAAAPLQRKPLRSFDMPETRQVAQRINLEDIETDRIEVENSGPDYVAYYDGAKAGTLELFEDADGRMWINNVETKEEMQGKGIGLTMLQRAVSEHGAIYASSASKQEHEDYGGGGDTRYLSTEGAALVASAIRNGVMQEEWLRNPFLMAEHFGNAEEEEDGGQEPESLLDFSDAGLPPLPSDESTRVHGYYNLEHAVDGQYLELVAVSVGTGMSPPTKNLDYPMWASSEAQIRASLASYYQIDQDHVDAIPLNFE